MRYEKEYFVKENSIVRAIWGHPDTILVIFAGAAAEFALNKEVDWLFYTGRLPNDPIGRLFSTVAYAREIVFSENQEAEDAIDRITAIHRSVETQRGYHIPDEAYRDVLFMLIDYSVRSFELLFRKLNVREEEEVFGVFLRVGKRMRLKDLPENLCQWKIMRQQHLHENLKNSSFTKELFHRYRKQLGPVRYRMLLETQKTVTPPPVSTLLKFKNPSLITPLIPLYKCSRNLKLDGFIKNFILPSAYKEDFKKLDQRSLSNFSTIK